MQRQAGLPLKANPMHTIASILLSVLGIYSPADVAGLPTHLYKNFTVQELTLKLKGKNPEFCLTAFMPGRSLIRACLSDVGHEHDTWFDTMLGFAISAYALKSRIALTVEDSPYPGTPGDLLELQICPLNGYCE